MAGGGLLDLQLHHGPARSPAPAVVGGDYVYRLEGALAVELLDRQFRHGPARSPALTVVGGVGVYKVSVYANKCIVLLQ